MVFDAKVVMNIHWEPEFFSFSIYTLDLTDHIATPYLSEDDERRTQ